MINETSGVLEAPDKSLCYFEKEDLNIKSKVSMEDLAAVMSVTQINFQVDENFSFIFFSASLFCILGKTFQ